MTDYKIFDLSRMYNQFDAWQPQALADALEKTILSDDEVFYDAFAIWKTVNERVFRFCKPANFISFFVHNTLALANTAPTEHALHPLIKDLPFKAYADHAQAIATKADELAELLPGLLAKTDSGEMDFTQFQLFERKLEHLHFAGHWIEVPTGAGLSQVYPVMEARLLTAQSHSIFSKAYVSTYNDKPKRPEILRHVGEVIERRYLRHLAT